MPSQIETPVKAYAHCVNPRCPGNNQVAVDAISVETSYAFSETGGDGMFGHPERTMNSLRFADPDESKCEHCKGHRDLSATQRMQLDDSGYDRMALLDISPDLRSPDGFADGGGHTIIDDARTTALEAENRELREAVAELRGIVLGQASVSQVPAEEPEEEDE